MEGDVLGAVFQHMDKGLSAVLLIFFLVKLLPQINKLVDAVHDMKETSDRRERQSDETQKELIRLMAQLKYQKVGNEAFKKTQ